jgi:hypothetical protein
MVALDVGVGLGILMALQSTGFRAMQGECSIPLDFAIKHSVSMDTLWSAWDGQSGKESGVAFGSMIFLGFFFFVNFNLLYASSSSASAMESSGLYSSFITFHSFRAFLLGKFLSALLSRLTLFKRLMLEKA